MKEKKQYTDTETYYLFLKCFIFFFQISYPMVQAQNCVLQTCRHRHRLYFKHSQIQTQTEIVAKKRKIYTLAHTVLFKAFAHFDVNFKGGFPFILLDRT